MNNMFQKVVIKTLTAPATKTATVTSSACDIRGYPGAMFVVGYGVSGDTLSGSVKWTAKLQDCETEGGSFADVATDYVESDVTGQTNSFGLVDAAADDEKAYALSYNGSSNFVKVVVTATGTHTYGTPIGIYAVLELPLAKTTEMVANP